ncbi:MAG: 6,7-dimethyl-8-ribityllumazine synthase [Phycisphaerales bacterium]|jgi:6,7-dimethyl-8-ribityllumazine synthase
MAAQSTNPSSQAPAHDPSSGALPPVAVVVSRYNRTITEALKLGAVEEYLRRGGSRESLAVIDVPGAFELPAIADAAAESGLYRGVCCLGCVIKGETSHDQHINNAVAQGLMAISLRLGVPATFGVLTTDTIEQAQARAGGSGPGAKGNKGAEAMGATLDAIAAIEAIEAATDAERPGLTFTLGGPTTDKATQTTSGRTASSHTGGDS